MTLSLLQKTADFTFLGRLNRTSFANPAVTVFVSQFILLDDLLDSIIHGEQKEHNYLSNTELGYLRTCFRLIKVDVDGQHVPIAQTLPGIAVITPNVVAQVLGEDEENHVCHYINRLTDLWVDHISDGDGVSVSTANLLELKQNKHKYPLILSYEADQWIITGKIFTLVIDR